MPWVFGGPAAVRDGRPSPGWPATVPSSLLTGGLSGQPSGFVSERRE